MTNRRYKISAIVCVCARTDSEGKSGIGWRESEEEERGGGEREGVATWESAWMIGGSSGDWCLGFSEERSENGDKSSHRLENNLQRFVNPPAPTWYLNEMVYFGWNRFYQKCTEWFYFFFFSSQNKTSLGTTGLIKPNRQFGVCWLSRSQSIVLHLVFGIFFDFARRSILTDMGYQFTLMLLSLCKHADVDGLVTSIGMHHHS